MLKYAIPQTNCSLFHDPQEAYSKFVFRLDFESIGLVSERIFPGLTKEKLSIIHAPFLKTPVCFPEDNLIFLSPDDLLSIPKNIYQLGHELCHIYIKNPTINQPMFWFEEVLCEIASHLFLEEYARLWSKPLNPIQQQIASSLQDYSKVMLEEAAPFDLTDLATPYTRLMQYLHVVSDDRPVNTYFASQLLPIFKKYPKLIEYIPVMKHFQDKKDFLKFLKAWQEVLPTIELKQAITEIISLITIP